MPQAGVPAEAIPASINLNRSGDVLTLILTGDWLKAGVRPQTGELTPLLSRAEAGQQLCFDASQLGRWDTGLVTALVTLYREAASQRLEIDLTGLPDGARSLLELAFAVTEPEGARRSLRQPGLFEQCGIAVLGMWAALRELVYFSGELILSLGRLMRGKATWQQSRMWLALQETGVEALPIVGLISFLIGMIFAFVGVKQLSDFGAGIYTADLVAVAMVREMAPIMTGIIMAGRTGAAYAAELGTMKVNEEIDALTTFGIHPIDYLVLPRFLALLLMMPFLTLYASLLGIIGGAIVAVTMLETTPLQYILQSNTALTLENLLGGLFKSVVYGSMVALTGTQQGMACGSSAMAVGQATTRAVVMGIVLIVVSASVLTIIYINLGI